MISTRSTKYTTTIDNFYIISVISNRSLKLLTRYFTGSHYVGGMYTDNLI